MKCQRCTEDTRVGPHVVDDFTGHICEECRAVWERVGESETSG